ncbi:glycosyltransferase [Leptospira ognonensis]|uniref:glycosyltransferase n=1 Tax=Leptospira ognonensis TaxID=2484945 RepID=UPI0014384A7D|nr:glycosyltransferase [Leptospira ognonensis]
MKNPPTISVITATFNAEKYLPRLIESLRNQTDKDFSWIVADGGSTDKTLEILKKAKDLRLTLTSQADFGIYDALNRGIKNVSSEYYIVMGADDRFNIDAIANYRNCARESNADIIAAAVKVGDKIWYPRKNYGWLYGMAGVASSHSVGLLIRRSLHNKYGYYPKNLSITADQMFIKQALMKGASIYRDTFIAGELNLTGFSSNSVIHFMAEFFTVQMKTERFRIFQICLFFLRLMKNFKHL